jgi:hypothetical protein
MRRCALVLFFIAAPTSTPAFASSAWTFCVASALGSKDVWITNLFATETDRERLELELKSFIERQRRARIVAQCPQPSDDEVYVLNAQETAREFNRKLGAALHTVPLRDFPPRN